MKEWIELIIEAKNMGFTVEEVREALNKLNEGDENG